MQAIQGIERLKMWWAVVGHLKPKWLWTPFIIYTYDTSHVEPKQSKHVEYNTHALCVFCALFCND